MGRRVDGWMSGSREKEKGRKGVSFEC